jgi:histidinol dehydrogenase
MLKRLQFADIPADCSEPVDPKALEQAKVIVSAIRNDGEKGMLQYATKFGDVKEGEQWWADKEELKAAYDTLDAGKRDVLTRVGERIRAFAKAQRASICDTETDIPGGKAGQLVTPVDCAGCYAPGGRYPLPSSVLMTAVTAREAGVKSVWVASPHPDQVTKAAAHVADADGLIKIGGAQAVATLAEGVGPVPAANIIVGPGNQWVTAAKSIVQGRCAIDMLAGPSEVLVIADESASPKVVAADLLAQAEHDIEARPILVTTHAALHDAVNAELAGQLKELPSPNRETATAAVSKGFCIVVGSMDEAIKVSDAIAPEHLEIMTANPMQVGMQCNHYGGLFIGNYAAEVLGDYGCGPNHVLPTAGTAKYTGGLSVHTFLRIRTWMRVDSQADNQDVVQDAIALARMEGLEAHARAAEARKL